MSLHDLFLTEALKIQVQILGAPQARDAIHATLHCQLAWRVQNHAVDLSLPGGQDALFLNVDATTGTTQCTLIPRQISREELVKVLPNTRVMKYVKLRVHPQHVFFDEPSLAMPKVDMLNSNCKGCQEDDLDNANTRKRYGNSEKELKRKYEDGDPTIGSLSHLDKYKFLVSYKTQNESALPTKNGTSKNEHAS
ncbi:hypothetical protein R3W88_026764 [Solanum pinnatisectum]|uniref:Uncharacterized protein n=1 Tax=Solanum pinnatisectum TaxID=50273 RepID=A0AAV9LE55_9SOLN|nr:hypothetical protein R3W88_026764 [Solanum pinnatisectum]